MQKRKCEQCNITRAEDAFSGPRGKLCKKCRKANTKRSAHASHIWKTYELSIEDYEEMAKNGCNACGGERNYNLHVDHDHSVVEALGIRASVRGVLCKRCNQALRLVRSSRPVLQGLKDYLERYEYHQEEILK